MPPDYYPLLHIGILVWKTKTLFRLPMALPQTNVDLWKIGNVAFIICRYVVTLPPPCPSHGSTRSNGT